ncbi:MAG: STAS/SEC14 domain-containing protein, partial [bacterium]
MTQKQHGISIGIERIDSSFLMNMKAWGKLTHQDYQVITPVIDSATRGISDPKVKVFFDLSEMQGWELRAAWDDFKIGLKHGSEFVKIALYGHKKWQEYAAKVGTWFTAGQIKFFEDKNDAYK